MSVRRRQHHLAFVVSVIAIIRCGNGNREVAPSSRQVDIRLQERFSFGDPDTFTEVSDLFVDRYGGIYVLDALEKKAIRLDQSGQPVTDVGKEGNGPGELVSPEAITFCPAEKLWILDSANLRLSVFETSGNTLAFGRDVPIPFPAADFCMVGNNMFLLGLFRGHLLHTLSPRGEVVSSFDSADSYGLDVDGPRAYGSLLCDEPTDTVLVVPSSKEAIHAFSSSGELVWITKQSDLHLPKSDDTSSTAQNLLDSKHGKAITLVTILPGIALVQVAEDAPHGEIIHSRFVSLSSGSDMGYRSDLPRILFARDGVAYAVVSAPHLQVIVYDVLTS
jgi:hypothetical protein